MAQFHPTRIVRTSERKDGASAAERRLWSRLQNARSEGFQFRRHLHFDGHVVDFFCASAHLAVELSPDGEGSALTRLLQNKGYSVIRLSHDEVNQDPGRAALSVVGACKVVTDKPSLILS